MQKVRIRLPAVASGFGPIFDSAGLALSLHAEFEVSFRQDDEIIVETSGEGAGRYPTGLRHPVVVGLSRVFQLMERAPQGLNVHVRSEIPVDAGLGAETVHMVAGIVAANYLSEKPLGRRQLIEYLAQHVPRPHVGITSLVGGLTSISIASEQVHTYTYPLTNFRLIVAIPRPAPDYVPPSLPERLPTKETLLNLRRLPILLHMLSAGRIAELEHLMRDSLLDSYYQQHIPGYLHIQEIARLAGARAIGVSGGGPALLIFSDQNTARVAEAVEVAYENLGIGAWVRVVSVDTQGVAISMVQSA